MLETIILRLWNKVAIILGLWEKNIYQSCKGVTILKHVFWPIRVFYCDVTRKWWKGDIVVLEECVTIRWHRLGYKQMTIFRKMGTFSKKLDTIQEKGNFYELPEGIKSILGRILALKVITYMNVESMFWKIRDYAYLQHYNWVPPPLYSGHLNPKILSGVDYRRHCIQLLTVSLLTETIICQYISKRIICHKRHETLHYKMSQTSRNVTPQKCTPSKNYDRYWQLGLGGYL